jgi:O-antigen/teichoic acid export membrane protein
LTESIPPEPAGAATTNAEPLRRRRELRSLVVSGIRWKLGSQILLQGLSLASTLTLARLLTPHDFGLAAIALAFGSLAFLLADLGLGSALVQRSELTEDDRSTAFWTNAALGSILTLVGVGLSWPLADLFHEPRIQPLFAVLSITFVVTALGTTQGALLIRGLQFRSLQLRTLAAASMSLVAAVALALLGYGPWAIIAQALVNCSVSTILLWRSSAWRPRGRYSKDSLRHLLRFGGPVFGSGLVWYVERNLDNILVGRFRGAAALGAYSLAYNIMLAPLTKIVQPVQQVFFPALSRIEVPDELGALWLRMSRLLAAITVPALLGIAVVAPEFVDVVLGEQWSGAVRVLQILAWVGLIQLAAAQTTTILLAVGRPGIVFRFAVASAALSIAGFAIGLHWGIVGVAVGYAIANTVLIPTYVAIGGRTIGVSLRDFAHALGGVVAAGCGMALVVLGLRLFALEDISEAGRLVVLIIAGIAVYVPLCGWRAPELREEFRRIRGPRAA